MARRVKRLLLFVSAALCAAPLAAQSTFPTALGGRVAGVVPMGCDANGANCAIQVQGDLPSSSASVAITPVVTTAVASSLVVKASAGNLYQWAVTSGASAGYVMIFNATSAPADGAVTPTACRTLAANSTLSSVYTQPARFSTGITVVFSTTGCFTKTASATAYIEGLGV